MVDNNEELKEQIKALKAEVDELKKQLKENSDNDERRHQEIKALKKSQHEDDVKWKKIGTFTAPLSALATIITLWLSIRSKKNGDGEPKNNSSKPDLSGIAEIIKEAKK